MMFTRWLLGRMIFVWMQYSFSSVASSCMDFQMYVARPTLVPFGRRCSSSAYPLNWGGSAIHVSCRHRTSKSSYLSIANNFRYVSPCIFILPTEMPCFVYQCISLGFCPALRLDPFVLFRPLDFLYWVRAK